MRDFSKENGEEIEFSKVSAIGNHISNFHHNWDVSMEYIETFGLNYHNTREYMGISPSIFFDKVGIRFSTDLEIEDGIGNHVNL